MLNHHQIEAHHNYIVALSLHCRCFIIVILSLCYSVVRCCHHIRLAPLLHDHGMLLETTTVITSLSLLWLHTVTSSTPISSWKKTVMIIPPSKKTVMVISPSIQTAIVISPLSSHLYHTVFMLPTCHCHIDVALSLHHHYNSTIHSVFFWL